MLLSACASFLWRQLASRAAPKSTMSVSTQLAVVPPTAASLLDLSHSWHGRLQLSAFDRRHACDVPRHEVSIKRSLSRWPHRLGGAELTAGIEAAASWNATVLVAIRNNKLFADTSRLVAGSQYWEELQEELLELLELVEVRDVLFVLSLNDGAVVDAADYDDGTPSAATTPAVLSFTGSETHADILVPGPHLMKWARPRPVHVVEPGSEFGAWREEVWAVDGVLAWAERVPRLFWRGTNSFARQRASGARECVGASFWEKCTARAILVAASLEQPDEIDAGFATFEPWDHCLCGTPYAEVKRRSAKPFEPMAAQGNHRYLATIDGYTAAWRLARLVSLGSLVFKQASHYMEFWYQWLKPWGHYVPLSEDVADVREKLAWARAHDDEARRIAHAGQRLVRRALSIDQLRCYWARLLDELGARQANAAAPAGGLELPPAFAGIYEKPVRPDEDVCGQVGTSDC